MKAVLRDHAGCLNRLEQLSCRARKDGDGVRRRIELVREKARNAIDVAVETLAFGRIRCIRAAARFQLLAGECLMLVAPVLVRSRIEIETHDWIWRRLKTCKPVELFSQRHTPSIHWS